MLMICVVLYAGVNQVTLSLTRLIVDWRISIFHIADPTKVLDTSQLTKLPALITNHVILFLFITFH